MVMAVFMAVFLVGCLWYLIGVGDAAVYRQKMQDGSDAAAFASAVYHARGMNIIAMLNLIMMAVLAVLVALKIIQIITLIVMAITAVLCVFGVGCPVLAAATNFESRLAQIIPKVETWVDKILRAISTGQVWIARITPWAGSARSVVASVSYQPTVMGGAGLSVSMIPGDPRLGLPVEEDEFETLCEKSGQFVGDLVLGWLPGGWGKFASGAVGTLTKTFPTYFCGGKSTGNIKDAAKNTAKLNCDDAKKQYDSDPANDPKNKPFDIDGCKKAEENKEVQGKLDSIGGSQMDGTGKTPKKVYYQAQNGDDYFQVYSFVAGDNSTLHERSDKRVEMAAWGKGSADGGIMATLMGAVEKTGFSGAEFYYDQVEKDKLTWDKYKDDAMWNMRWRARLRRFRIPTVDGTQNLLKNGIPSWVPGIPEKYKGKGMSWVDGQIEQAIGDTGFAKWLKGEIEKQTGIKDGKDGADNVATKIDSTLDTYLGSAGSATIIH